MSEPVGSSRKLSVVATAEPATRAKRVDTTPPVATLGPIEDDFPNSRKGYLEQDGLRVPMREIRHTGSEQPPRVYGATGPSVVDLREGLPKLRAPWIHARLDGGDAT